MVSIKVLLNCDASAVYKHFKEYKIAFDFFKCAYGQLGYRA